MGKRKNGAGQGPRPTPNAPGGPRVSFCVAKRIEVGHEIKKTVWLDIMRRSASKEIFTFCY